LGTGSTAARSRGAFAPWGRRVERPSFASCSATTCRPTSSSSWRVRMRCFAWPDFSRFGHTRSLSFCLLRLRAEGTTAREVAGPSQPPARLRPRPGLARERVAGRAPGNRKGESAERDSSRQNGKRPETRHAAMVASHWLWNRTAGLLTGRRLGSAVLNFFPICRRRRAARRPPLAVASQTRYASAAQNVGSIASSRAKSCSPASHRTIVCSTSP
jgi:hypothetical protein